MCTINKSAHSKKVWKLIVCSQRRLLRRGLEFHVCTINKSAHSKKVWKLIVCSRRRLLRRGLEFHVCTINKSAHSIKSLETYRMQPEEITSKGTRVSCVYYQIKVPIRKKVWKLIVCSQRRLLRRGLEFHVCTINKSAHSKKVWKLIVCSRRRLLRRGLEFHVCTINKSAHSKKVWKLIVCTS